MGPILMVDSNHLAAFSKMILERKKFREPCTYLEWMYFPVGDLERISAPIFEKCKTEV